MSDSGLNLQQALSECKPPEILPLMYRLYHDSDGLPLRYSMQEEPGDWIEITCEQYHRASSKVRVRAGRLELLDSPIVGKLRPGSSGVLCHTRDVCVIIDHAPGTYWRLDHEED